MRPLIDVFARSCAPKLGADFRMHGNLQETEIETSPVGSQMEADGVHRRRP